MRVILLASVIGLAVSLATPARAHLPSQCDPHLREYIKLEAEKGEMIEHAIIERMRILEQKKDLIIDHMRRTIEGTTITEEEMAKAIETREFDTSSLFLEAILFDSQNPTRVLTQWMNCLAGFRDILPEEEHLPTLREWLDLHQ